MLLDEIKGKLGFGCMRLPMNGEEVDLEHFSKMIDTYLENDFNYFDTAHGYLDGKSELALRECLTARHPRTSYLLANKLSNPYFEKEEDILPFFNQQLLDCGVDYFDLYLMHAQEKTNYEKYKSCRAYETAFELKKQGKVRYVGISFHDNAETLERILTDYPDLDFVQIQFNYADFNDPAIDSKNCYEVCVRHGKPVIVMEPVKGGALVNKLPEPALALLRELGGGSPASYAIRFCAGFPGIACVLSGMGDMDMMSDNISYMKDFKPLNETEQETIQKVCDLFHAQNLIQCTACRYCVAGCPQNIPIPDLFACLNGKKAWRGWTAGYYYKVHTHDKGKAGDCIECGACEDICPQHLPIRDLLKDVAETFEKKNKE